jgi:hypothetical protein
LNNSYSNRGGEGEKIEVFHNSKKTLSPYMAAQRFKERGLVLSGTKFDVVHIAIDPLCLGICEFAIVAVGGSESMEVLAVASEITKSAEQAQKLIRTTLAALKVHPRILPTAHFVVEISGLSCDAMYIGPWVEEMARDLGMDLDVVRKMTGGQCGVPATHTRYLASVAIFEERVRTEQICVASDCVFISAATHPKLCDQLIYIEKKGVDELVSPLALDDIGYTLLWAIFWGSLQLPKDILLRSPMNKFQLKAAMILSSQYPVLREFIHEEVKMGGGEVIGKSICQ